MKKPLDDLYFDWLSAKVIIGSNGGPTYFKLLKLLYDTEFVWVILGDDNRAADGQELRDDFVSESGISVDADWLDESCSVLEMMIALAKRAEFQIGFSVPEWFWIFITNLRLADFDDDKPVLYNEVGTVLDNFIWRTYDYDGTGGMFPLRDPPEDQTNVELWYQLSEYVIDQDI